MDEGRVGRVQKGDATRHGESHAQQERRREFHFALVAVQHPVESAALRKLEHNAQVRHLQTGSKKHHDVWMTQLGGEV